MKMLDVKVQVLTCDRCELSKSCRSPVPLTGPPNPRFIVVGEAPGRIEDRRGVPFTGPAGQLLRKGLEKVGLEPKDGAWMNCVSCWPHGTPDTHHIDACRDNLKAQWDVVRAKHVLVVGSTALQTLVPHAQFKYVDGMSIPIHNKYLFPVRHPAFILRQDRDAYGNWLNRLRIFATTVVEKAEPVTEFCMYCEKYRQAYAPTCYKHAGLYREDCKWKYSPPIQGRLDV